MIHWTPEAIQAHLTAIEPGSRGYVARCQVRRAATPEGDRYAVWLPGHCACGPADQPGLTLEGAIAVLARIAAP